MIKTDTFITPSNTEVEVCFASPSQFILQHQSELLPGWQTSIDLIVLFLQESNLSFKGSSREIIAEKDRLRANFLRFGTSLIFTLQDRGYQSDLFDPRTGYPWLTQPGITLDDNAVVKALLDYPAINYKNCSLLNHPLWGDRIYPATIVTAAPRNIVEPLSKQLLINRGLTLATFEL